VAANRSKKEREDQGEEMQKAGEMRRRRRGSQEWKRD